MDEEICYQNKYFKIESIKINQAKDLYYKLKINDSVIICVLDSDDKLWFVRQYRPNLGYETTEMVAGEIESGETPQEAAERELREELGMEANLKQIGRPQRMMMNRTDNKYYFFLGIKAGIISGHKPEEGISAMSIKRKEFKRFAEDVKLEHMASMALISMINIEMNLDFLKSDYSEIIGQ